MAALFVTRHSFQPPVAFHGPGLSSFSRLVRRAGVATFAHARLFLAAVGNLMLFVWTLVALAVWSLILIGLFR